MFRKTSKRYEPRKTNAFGWSRKRGGAGGVACALAVTALLLTLAIASASNYSAKPDAYSDEPVIPVDGFDDPDWDPPEKPAVSKEYNAGTPSRLPI